MRFLLCALVFLASHVALASGKITFKPSVAHDGSEKGYALGLAVFEKVLPGLFVDAWHGYGEKLDDSDKWFKSDVSLVAYIGHVGLGCGNTSVYDLEQKSWSHRVFGKVSLDLW